jgi:hypothetical protein
MYPLCGPIHEVDENNWRYKFENIQAKKTQFKLISPNHSKVLKFQ